MKTCNTCAHYDVCRSWTQPQYRCGNYLPAPPCKIGDLLFVPAYDEDEAEWYVDIIPVNDVGQRFIFCPRSLSNADDTAETFAVDRIGVYVFLTMEEARGYIKRKESES
jgi:hypothetical protein